MPIIKDHVGDEPDSNSTSGVTLNRATLQRYHSGPKLGKQPGYTISKWMYGIEDQPAATVLTKNYFNPVADELGKGDIIEVVGNFDTKPELKFFIITKIEDGVVTVEASK